MVREEEKQTISEQIEIEWYIIMKQIKTLNYTNK